MAYTNVVYALYNIIYNLNFIRVAMNFVNIRIVDVYVSSKPENRIINHVLNIIYKYICIYIIFIYIYNI